jgi:hypothetical protein
MIVAVLKLSNLQAASRQFLPCDTEQMLLLLITDDKEQMMRRSRPKQQPNAKRGPYIWAACQSSHAPIDVARMQHAATSSILNSNQPGTHTTL